MKAFLISHKILTIMLCIVVLAFALYFVWWQNNDIVVTHYSFASKKVSTGLDGFRIVQISDLHNKDYGQRLLSHIETQHPDIIVITGDLIDNRSKNIHPTIDLLEQALRLAPVFYVSGNNEEWSNRYKELAAQLTEIGVTVLENEAVRVTPKNADVSNSVGFNLIGIVDPEFLKNEAGYVEKRKKSLIKKAIEQNMVAGENMLAAENLPVDRGILHVLLAHRPELLEVYAACNVDLVFSGHAHGGQVRLPFVGGLIAPNQGFFPKYTSGLHVLQNTTMVISRGLGNSIIPLRLFNRPELVVVTLKGEAVTDKD
jgi:predicted MPP superfamily phosphohydrolase